MYTSLETLTTLAIFFGLNLSLEVLTMSITLKYSSEISGEWCLIYIKQTLTSCNFMQNVAQLPRNGHVRVWSGFELFGEGETCG